VCFAERFAIDDAHDREDIGLLMRHCADEATQSSLLLVLRPYGSEMVKREAASFALSGENVRSVYLGRPSLEDATKLAAEALEASRGPIGAAQDLARITRGSPLATVLGAQVVAKEGIHPVWMNNDAEFQTLILSRFAYARNAGSSAMNFAFRSTSGVSDSGANWMCNRRDTANRSAVIVGL
jgi:hypothetical protein